MIFDAPLTERGKSQAHKAREKVLELGIKHVIASPLTRAVQTAKIIFDGVAPITIDATHRELLSHSCDVGRHPDLLYKDFPSIKFDHLHEHWWHNGSTNENDVPIEPEAVFQERVSTFKTNISNIDERPVAFVGHGNFFQELLGRMLENCEISAYRPGR